MLLDCDVSIALGYKSQPQVSRVLSEKWLQDNGYCLSCESDRLVRTAANTKASDFVCQFCNENYELKTFRKRPGRTLVDGAYSALISRIEDGSVPTLMLLERNNDWQIQGLTAIHRLFLTPQVIEKRKPLSPTARRAGWVGCNIRLDLIAPDAQIPVVQERIPNNPQAVRESFQRFDRLKNMAPISRGWATLTLRILRSLDRELFSLPEIYALEATFRDAYPGNSHIRAKIRQQLQALRDLGYLKFLGRGTYKFLI